MLLELCFSVTLQDERREAVPIKSSCSLAFVCHTTTLYDERQKVSGLYFGSGGQEVLNRSF